MGRKGGGETDLVAGGGGRGRGDGRRELGGGGGGLGGRKCIHFSLHFPYLYCG